MNVADLVEDERKLLNRRNDDLLFTFDEAPQITGALGMSHRSSHLDELPDCVPNLLVENDAVRHDNDRIKGGLAIPLDTDQLMREPRNGIGLTRTCRMLNKVAFARLAPRPEQSSTRTCR
jgi:hypothetical protein